MSKELTDFLTDLATNDKLVKEFEQDKEGTMKKAGVSSEHIDLVVNKKYDEIQEILGADFDIVSHDVIKAYKK